MPCLSILLERSLLPCFAAAASAVAEDDPDLNARYSRYSTSGDTCTVPWVTESLLRNAAPPLPPTPFFSPHCAHKLGAFVK